MALQNVPLVLAPWHQNCCFWYRMTWPHWLRIYLGFLSLQPNLGNVSPVRPNSFLPVPCQLILTNSSTDLTCIFWAVQCLLCRTISTQIVQTVMRCAVTVQTFCILNESQLCHTCVCVCVWPRGGFCGRGDLSAGSVRRLGKMLNSCCRVPGWSNIRGEERRVQLRL